ncbi:hypothetical protein V8C35DRAFT_312193 [Trichoderma chlorosporum]
MHDASELLLRYAAETEDDSYDSAVEYEFYNGKDPWDEDPYEGRVFHKFTELPPELRLRIWELGLVEVEQPRVLQFEVHAIPRKMPGLYATNDFGDRIQRLFRDWHVRPGRDLSRVTKQTRSIMAVSREAREVARKKLPHSLKTQNPSRNGHGLVYCNRDRDVVHISGYEREHINPWAGDESLIDSAYHFDGFAENVVQLAIDSNAFNANDPDTDTDSYFNHAMEPFHNLKRLFLLSHPRIPLASDEKLWCGSDFVYTHTTAIKDRGNGYFWTKRCWPNADDYDDFVRNQIPTPDLEGVPFQGRPLIPTRGIMLLPMLAFDNQDGLKALDKLRAKWQKSYELGISIEELSDFSSDSDSDSHSHSHSHSDSDSDSQSESDEYESEGIDDSEIIENNSEDDSDEDTMSGDEIYTDHDDDTVGEDQVGEIVPVFSSPEPEPEPNEHRGPVSEAQGSRKRRIVTDSDDEDASEESGAKRARTGRFSARVVTSDTEDEGVNKSNSSGRSRRRAAIVDSDDEDDEVDDDSNGAGASGSLNKDESSTKAGKGSVTNGVKSDVKKQTDEDDGEDDDDDDEEEEEEEVTDVRRLSLATRLELVRPKHPSSRKRKTEDETMSTDPENYTDEDEDEDEEDEDEERSQDDLIDGIAEESDESDYE